MDICKSSQIDKKKRVATPVVPVVILTLLVVMIANQSGSVLESNVSGEGGVTANRVVKYFKLGGSLPPDATYVTSVTSEQRQAQLQDCFAPYCSVMEFRGSSALVDTCEGRER
jgi:hypothetical protein